jgi:hypothetical protein
MIECALRIQPAVRLYALIAQTVEHILGKNEAMGSSPIEGSRNRN